MIDAAHYWAQSTIGTNARNLRKLRSFCGMYDIPMFDSATLVAPPATASIPIMWAMEEYTLQKSAKTNGRIRFNTARALRSAASSLYSWEMALAHPGHVYQDSSRRTLKTQGVSPSDDLLLTLSTKGMAKRLGTEVKPSAALHQ
jgi:hypothetical protein